MSEYSEISNNDAKDLLEYLSKVGEGTPAVGAVSELARYIVSLEEIIQELGYKSDWTLNKYALE